MITSDRSFLWRAAYGDVLGRIPAIVARARPTLCGLAACVDATVSLHDADALVGATEPIEAVRLAALLLERAAAGTGGEIRIDWPDGPQWLDRRVPVRLDLGGSGPQAARALTVLGAPAILALETRSPEQLAVLDPGILIAADGRIEPARALVPSRPNSVKVYIFEYTMGRRLGEIVPPRSSRIIVRFHDSGLENDDLFDRLSVTMDPRAGAGILSGFSAIAAGDLDAGLARARSLGRRWLAAGVSTVHLELAGYACPEYRDRTLTALTGSMTSLGLSYSEFRELVPDVDLAGGMLALAERLELRRVCVHADQWAAAATLDDAETERDALLMGCLLASTRASHGRPVVPAAIPPDAIFEELPVLPASIGGRHIVACAAPYLARPTATVGLGDTFMAGCLAVLGQQPNEDRNQLCIY